MISFLDVVVRYPGASRPALSGVSLEAPRGRITAVVGPNGSGKSTLVRALIGRQALTGGRIEIDGHDLATLDRRQLARTIAVITQREQPAFPLPVQDYVALGRYPHVGRWQGWGGGDNAAVRTALERAEIVELAARRTDELSGGEWQRVRIARALAQGGDALVLDEPTTFLDVAHEMSTFELLDTLAREGTAVLLVSHQLNLVARFASTLVLLDTGTVAAAGSPAEGMQGSTLERVYHWPLVVVRDAAVGAPALVPLRGRGSNRPGA